MSMKFGGWADSQFLPPNREIFYKRAQHWGSCLLVDDWPKYEDIAELRARNPQMWLGARRHFDKWEGEWDLCPTGTPSHPMDPQSMANVLMDGYRPELNFWVQWWNEPALYNDRLKAAMDLVLPTLEILVRNKVKCVVWNAWFSTHTDKEGRNQLPIMKPMFEYIFRNQKYLSLGGHMYGLPILDLSVGGRDQMKAVDWGSWPESKWATTAQMKAGSKTGLIGGHYHWIEYLKSDAVKCWPLPMDMTEGGMDDTGDPAVMALLKAANGGQDFGGAKAVEAILKRHFPADYVKHGFEYLLWRQMRWLLTTLTEFRSFAWFGYTLQQKWNRYSIDTFEVLLSEIEKYNKSWSPIETLPEQVPTPATWRDELLAQTNLKVMQYLAYEIERDPEGLYAWFVQKMDEHGNHV